MLNIEAVDCGKQLEIQNLLVHNLKNKPICTSKELMSLLLNRSKNQETETNIRFD